METSAVNVFLCERGHIHKADGCPLPKEKSLEDKFDEFIILHNSHRTIQSLSKELVEIAEEHFAKKV